MRPLAELPDEHASSLVGLLFDLDDTVLTHGVLTCEAFDAIWSMHDAGIRLVAVTGRPSGWGEVIARQWPIDGAITENGAVHVVRDGKGVELLFDGTAEEVLSRRERLDALV
jgi:hydroxymethylpyrimidine pyrophosphatase-like HAD family hydrolase